MRHAATLFFIALFTGAVHAQSTAAFDSTLARKFGADERGMRMYSFVLLKPGTRTDIPKAERDSLFHGHMANIMRLAHEGKLVLAGPFEKNDRYSGLFIFTTTETGATEELLRTDPAVAGGALGYEIYPWYGSAAVMGIPATHERIQRKGF